VWAELAGSNDRLSVILSPDDDVTGDDLNDDDDESSLTL